MMVVHFLSIVTSQIIYFLDKKLSQKSPDQSESFFQLKIFEFITKSLNLVKMVAYFVAIQYIQHVVIGYFVLDKGAVIKYENNFMVWLYYEVILFYANILAQCLFLFISRIFKFRTFKEKIVPGFPKSKRYLEDFMYFVKDDIHWFTLTIQQIILMAYALSQVNDKEGGVGK